MSDFWLSDEELAALHASIHQLAQNLVPGCTIEQIRPAINQTQALYNSGSYSRKGLALKLFWLLSEQDAGHISEHHGQRLREIFLGCLKGAVEKAQESEERAAQARERSKAARTFWIDLAGKGETRDD